MMKKRLASFALAALILGMAGCSDDEEDNTGGIILEPSEVSIVRGDSRLLWFRGDSEEAGYSAAIDDPAIASVQVQQTNLGPAVLVKAIKEGDAVITVTDNEGNSAKCSLTVIYKDIALHGTTMRIGMLDTPYHEPIIGGSGKFTATIDDPEIADVSIDISNWEMLVTAKKEGETKITVTDTETSKSVSLSLQVKESGYKITEIRYAVDATQKEEIEKDLQDNSPYPIGSTFYFSENRFVAKSPNGTEINSGAFTMEAVQTSTSFGIPIDDQIYAQVKFGLTSEDGTTDYNLFFVRGNYLYFCEDLTGYYKSKYPDAGVKQVGRGIVTRSNWLID